MGPRPDRDGAALRHELERAGILVQAGDPLGDDRRVRISVRAAAATQRLVRAFSGSGDERRCT